MKGESVYDRVKARITPEMKKQTRTKLEKIMVEHLLKPRWKVIADYPESNHYVGEIPNCYDNKIFIESTGRYIKPDDYPAIFKKLRWWEERGIEEMPKYIKSTKMDIILKVHTHFYTYNSFLITQRDGSEGISWEYHYTIPSTQEEFENHQNQIK